MDTKEIFKDFLKNNLQYVMHEQDVDNPSLEHFFLMFEMKIILNLSRTKERSADDVRAILSYFESFQNTAPMQNISKASLDFTRKKQGRLIYIPLGTLDKTHHFYLKRKREFDENYENILSLKILNEPANPKKHLHYTIDSKLSDIKDIGMGISDFAHDVVKDVVKENAPILKQKILSLGNKIKSFRK